MTCKSTQQTLLSLEDPAQPPVSIQTHLAGCPVCRDWQRRLLRIEQHVRHLPAPPAKEKETFLRLLEETPETKKRWVWQQLTRREAGIAVAAGLVLALGWWLWPTPRSHVASQPVAAVRDPFLVKLLDRDLSLARTNNPRDRVETLDKLADDLYREAHSVSLEASPEVLQMMANLYRQVIESGIVSQAKSLHSDDRKRLLAPIAERLSQVGSELERLVDRADVPARQPLRDFVAAAREGGKQLRSLQ